MTREMSDSGTTHPLPEAPDIGSRLKVPAEFDGAAVREKIDRRDPPPMTRIDRSGNGGRKGK